MKSIAFWVYVCFGICLHGSAVYSQTGSILDRVYLIGNYADVTNTHELIHEVQSLAESEDAPYVLLLTGDIVKDDLSDPGYWQKAKTKLQSLVRITDEVPRGTVIVIPGDRDWLNSGKKGLNNVELLEKLVKSLDNGHVIFDPDDGCPGPKSKEVGNSLTLVSVNTQWFNHPYDKPRDTEAECKYTNEVDYLEELGDIIDESAGRNVLIAGHFPLISNGIYGGRSPLAWHLIPVVGTFYAAYRQNIGTPVDLVNQHFDPIRQKMEVLLKEQDGVVYASGHEFNLQVLQKGKNIFVNSGSIANGKLASSDSTTLFSSSHIGFIELRYMEGGDVWTITYERNKDSVIVLDRRQVFQGQCTESNGNMPINSKYDGCLEKKPLPEPTSHNGNQTIVAGEEYGISGFGRLLLGDRYRSSWTTPVVVPVLDLRTVHGGLEPYKRGGGRQTQSLKFEAGDGRKYTFRSVNKDIGPALPYELREAGVSNLVQDQTSAQQPYGAMAADIMLNQLEVPHAHPVLYVMPDDPALGGWREEFGGMLGMLEEDPKDWKSNKLEGFYGADDVEKSYKLFHHLYEDHDNRMDDTLLAQARVFDIFVGDWGKHQDNWKWAEYKTKDGSIYKPIPRDRDHIFSKWDGLLPYLYTREWAAGTFARFTGKIENIEQLVWPARELDRSLLTQLDRQDWQKAASKVQDAMTNEVLRKAIMNMPSEIYEPDGAEIEERLKSRRDILPQRIDKYYLFLAKEVEVIGSNKRDYFEVIRNGNGSVDVNMFDVQSGTNDKDAGEQFYHRTFLPDETREIHLYGLGEDDVFNISGISKNTILIRVIPGPGQDVVNEESAVSGWGKNTYVYEKSDKAKINLGEEGRQKHPWDDNLFYYNRGDFIYDRYLPLPSISYNPYDGFGLGLGMAFTREKWGKQDYQSLHTLSGGFTTKGFYHIALDNRFHHVIHKWDVLLNGSYERPGSVHYFYGYGPHTTLVDSLYDNDYYQVRRTSLKIESGFSRQFARKSQFSIVGRYENNEDDQVPNNILDEVNVAGEKPFNDVEAEAEMDLDFRDNKTFPSRGARLYVSYTWGHPLGNNIDEIKSHYYLYKGTMEFFTSTRNRIFPLTFGIKGGYEKAAQNTPFYKMPTLGVNDHLKGYRKNRFSSDRLSYLNGEIRVKLFNLPHAFIPLELGISSFYDLANVNPTEELGGGSKWFSSYGGGIYMVPWNRNFTLSLSAGFSEEEQGIIVFGFGTLLNKGDER